MGDRVSTYQSFLSEVSEILEGARRQAARSVNAILTATYWEIGRRIVEFEQRGAERAPYGEELLNRLAEDLTARFGRGFSRQNIQQMRQFYLAYPPDKICQTLSGGSEADEAEICQTLSGKSPSPKTVVSPITGSVLAMLSGAFPLSWSHYVLLISRCHGEEARAFYETEALRGGWSVRQLERQMDSQFYERTALSRNKAAMLKKGAKARPEDGVAPEEEIKDPYILGIASGTLVLRHFTLFPSPHFK